MRLVQVMTSLTGRTQGSSEQPQRAGRGKEERGTERPSCGKKEKLNNEEGIERTRSNETCSQVHAFNAVKGAS